MLQLLPIVLMVLQNLDRVTDTVFSLQALLLGELLKKTFSKDLTDVFSNLNSG